jgi:hypothetical protein
MTEAILLPTDEEPMRPDRCGTCRFWQPIDPDNMTPEDRVSFTDGESDHVQGGECKRHPPVITDSHRYGHKPGRADTLTARWLDTVSPVTIEDDWCGEWQPAATKPLGGDPFHYFFKDLSVRAGNILRDLGVYDWKALRVLRTDDVRPPAMIREIATKARQHFGHCPLGWDDYLPGGSKHKA